MKKILSLSVVLLTGCSTTNISELTKALANDQATVSVSIQSVYGTVRFVRTNPRTNQTVIVDSSGVITVKP